MLTKIWLLLVVLVTAQVDKKERLKEAREAKGIFDPDNMDAMVKKKKAQKENAKKRWAENRNATSHRNAQYLENYSFDLPRH